MKYEDDVWYLTPEEAEANLVVDGDDVHCFVNPNGMLIGADWSKAEVVAALKKAKSIRVGGDTCRRMNHAIVVFDGKKELFFASKDTLPKYEAKVTTDSVEAKAGRKP